MKYCYFLLFAIGCLLLYTGCNGVVTVETPGQDSAAVTPDKQVLDSLQVLTHINDSLNLVVKNFTSVIAELQDSSEKYSGDKKEQILDCRARIASVRKKTMQLRDKLTSGAIASLGEQLMPVINTLTNQLQSLKKLSERIEGLITTMGIIDKTLTAAISAGVLSPPVSLTTLPAP